MKVVLSARVEADIASQLDYGLQHFGPAVAERTFARVDTFLFQFLPDYPYTGKYLEEHGIYETWVGRTPFVIFYRVNTDARRSPFSRFSTTRKTALHSILKIDGSRL